MSLYNVLTKTFSALYPDDVTFGLVGENNCATEIRVPMESELGRMLLIGDSIDFGNLKRIARRPAVGNEEPTLENTNNPFKGNVFIVNNPDQAFNAGFDKERDIMVNAIDQSVAVPKDWLASDLRKSPLS